MRLERHRKRNGEWVWWAYWSERHRDTGRTVTRKRSTGCTTRAAAELVVARWERERADPVYAASNAATFGVEAGLFLAACRDAVARKRMRPGTLSMYEQKAGTLVRILGAELRLALIDGSTFARYIAARREDFRASTTTAERPEGKEITESTLYKEWVAFRGILTQAWRAQRFGRDPRSLKPAHFGPEYQPRETALTWEQVHALLAQLGARSGPAAYALATGARRSEVLRAEAGDIDRERWRVKIRGTKTDAAAATIPVPSLMRPLLAGVTPPFAPWPNARRGLAAAARRAGCPLVTWNDLRRTFASLLVQAGVAPHLVAKLLRHKSTAMVDKVYGRQTAESLDDLIEGQLRGTQVEHTKAD